MKEFYVMMRPKKDATGRADLEWLVVGGPWHDRWPADRLKDTLDTMNKPRHVEVMAVVSHEQREAIG